MTMPTDAIVCSWIRPVAFACGCVHFGTSSRTFRTSAFIGLSATWSIPLTALWTEVSKASLARLAGGETHPLTHTKSLAGVCLADTARQDAELESNKTLHNCAKKSGYPMLKCDTCSVKKIVMSSKCCSTVPGAEARETADSSVLALAGFFR